MPLQILQKPSDIQPAQSPIIFSVTETSQSIYEQPEFQYVAYLWVWNGNLNESGSYDYQLRKFPNQTGSGIFDFNRLINSQLTDLSADNSSNVKYYKAVFTWQYASGSAYVSSSSELAVTCSVGGTPFKAYDGYALFPDQINSSLYDINPCWPFMTDMCTVTQSIMLTDTSLLGNAPAYRGEALWLGENNEGYANKLGVTASYASGNTIRSTVDLSAVTGSENTSGSVYNLKAAPGDSWVALSPTSGSSPLVSYKINAYSGSAITSTLNYEIVGECYYTPIRVAYKNKYGQFDWFNFYKRHNNTFNTEQRLYQPQLGSWSSQTLTYNKFQTRAQRYIVDATEVLEVNTDYIDQGYNDLFKQLLVADEIYWQTSDTGDVRPLTIQTNSLTFKTGVNDKLIQYTLTFDIGQPYKLLL
jgi:hypothetical protein